MRRKVKSAPKPPDSTTRPKIRRAVKAIATKVHKDRKRDSKLRGETIALQYESYHDYE